MCYTETKLTADAVENIFHVQFSQPGSTNRQEEARVLSYWRDYLLYLEEKETGPSLEDVLMFGTGLKEVPPAAIQPQPQLHLSSLLVETAHSVSLNLQNELGDYHHHKDFAAVVECPQTLESLPVTLGIHNLLHQT
ncbi:unnamed protein product [Leuciscus chuanchicus]